MDNLLTVVFEAHNAEKNHHRRYRVSFTFVGGSLYSDLRFQPQRGCSISPGLRRLCDDYPGKHCERSSGNDGCQPFRLSLFSGWTQVFSLKSQCSSVSWTNFPPAFVSRTFYVSVAVKFRVSQELMARKSSIRRECVEDLSRKSGKGRLFGMTRARFNQNHVQSNVQSNGSGFPWSRQAWADCGTWSRHREPLFT